jgi:hypothetical protein
VKVRPNVINKGQRLGAGRAKLSSKEYSSLFGRFEKVQHLVAFKFELPWLLCGIAYMKAAGWLTAEHCIGRRPFTVVVTSSNLKDTCLLQRLFL